MLLHIPHSSTVIPTGIIFLKDIEEDIARMTDWYTDELFFHPSSEIVKFNYSRLVCDVERFVDNEPMEKYGHGIAYVNDSYGQPLRAVSDDDRLSIINQYYKPHHTRLNQTSNQLLSFFETVVIVDCHSFSDTPLPHEIDTGLARPDFCLGIDEFHTPSILVERFTSYLSELGYTVAINNPFSGTLVPLHHYHKTTELKSIMIEVNRKLYLDDTYKNEHFTSIKSVITGLLNIVDHYESETL